ncbi:unnamed protein product [Eruca vesicaria subsp. sativa]|uniref:Uncharacterized protein n=1 Tax=Eruca vesicaria subsp. sativa TaxID=29727 RepID=A0ABC8KJQ7_ERUVS|nr:unnamed protein product [Eruca vesicaria subsp. sativa]
MSVDPRVIVATNTNPRMVGGIEIFRLLSITKDSGLSSTAPLLREIPKVKPLTIAEVNNFATIALSQIWKERPTLYNFTSSRQSFTITRILSELERLLLLGFIDNGGGSIDVGVMTADNPIPPKPESGGNSGERGLISNSAHIGSVLIKSTDTTLKVVKRPCLS